jgi:hypothetical protein
MRHQICLAVGAVVLAGGAVGPASIAQAASDDCGTLPKVSDPVSSQRADVNGDGKLDEIVTYNSGDKGRLRVNYANGASTEAVASKDILDSGMSRPTVTDVDRDGDLEIFSVVASSGFEFFAVFGLDGCRLAPVTRNGKPYSVLVGGEALDLAGAECRGGKDDVDFRTYVGKPDPQVDPTDSGSLPPGAEFKTTVTDYRLTGTQLIRTGSSIIRINADDEGLAGLDAIKSLRCGTAGVSVPSGGVGLGRHGSPPAEAPDQATRTGLLALVGALALSVVEARRASRRTSGR